MLGESTPMMARGGRLPNPLLSGLVLQESSRAAAGYEREGWPAANGAGGPGDARVDSQR
jgi:hypothetical protein